MIDFALIVDALRDLFDEAPPHKGLRFAHRGKVCRFFVGKPVGNAAPHHEQGVGESLGGNQAGLRAGAGDERVLADGAGVKEKSGGTKNFIGAGQAEVPRRVGDRVDRALGEIIRRRKRFADGDFAALAQDDAVGKSSADVDADDVFPF